MSGAVVLLVSLSVVSSSGQKRYSRDSRWTPHWSSCIRSCAIRAPLRIEVDDFPVNLKAFCVVQMNRSPLSDSRCDVFTPLRMNPD